MATRQPGRLPTSLLHGSVRVLRPQDAEGVYSHPRPEFARLVKSGVLHRLATGYYAIVPDDMVGLPWLPDLESAALGMAVADEGPQSVALMGISAARVHGAAPRALAVAVVAASHHRRPIQLADREARVIYARRNVMRIDVERHSLELGQGWVTTIEQTIIDLAARPELGDVRQEVDGAVHDLLSRADRDALRVLARAQRRTALVDRVVGNG
ncbi:MAG TPA: type IV toxin-antitoxin system AbiEi family antitoxin [Pseudonocardiaceae bacterium]|nr:type IV toxin-antitoxin system AbiEi family antitoxin [Pseudonocardiaceae bacterium]